MCPAGGGAGGDHGAGLKRHHQPHGDRKLKVVRLSELISVLRLPPNAEACPTENMAAFCVETQDRTMVFAALKDDCADWVDKLCQSTFQRQTGSGANQLLMEENQIYATTDEASEFLVVVQRTDAAIRCGLQGSYWLKVGQEALLLRETQRMNVIREWPYELLRRYGKDKLALTIEAGRRCESGPGTFTFETQQADKMFSMIQSTIKRKTSSVTSGNQNQDGDRIPQAHSPLPKIPDMTSMTSLQERKLRTEVKTPAAPEESDSAASSQCAPLQPAPITLMPLPMLPTHDSPSGHLQGGQSEAVYADPADCVQSVHKARATKAHYVDPASFLPLHPPNSKDPVTATSSSQAQNTCFVDPESDYSEVYDKVSPVHSQPKAAHSRGRRFADDEPIYAEPMSERQQESHRNESKPDPFAHLYARVCKTPPSASPSPSSPAPPPSVSPSSLAASMAASEASDQPLDDVIYENLGII